MKITFHGAARTVTGSQHLIEVNERQILLDCGLYQGKRQEAFERNRTLPFDASKVDVMVLSHAHIDHSGNIPNLVKSGFKGDIYATFATRDLCAVMLLDSAHIQENDVEFVNKKRDRKGEPPVQPLYTEEDATRSLQNFHAISYDRQVTIMPGVTLTYVDAGHMLGSAIVILNIEDRDANKDVTLVFGGDLGQPGLPILRDPTYVDRADVLILESTYGDRLHGTYKDSEQDLRRIVIETYKRGGKLIVPAFAVGRTQEIVYALNQLQTARKIPHMPVYVDSPLAVNVTAVFIQHPEAYDAETRAFLSGNKAIQNPFGFSDLYYVRSVEESKELNFLREPAIIISASGMAEAGRIQHHLANNIEDPKNTILIAGYQAENTLGRRIMEKEPTVRIFGDTFHLRAQVETVTGFSAHADRNALLHWAGAIKKKPLHTFLVHGEDKALNALADGLRKDVGLERVDIPDLHQSFGV
ncbi:MAG: MBL fold metallo-hydrolase [Anaerolineae bacterium]|nr:MBL fold metallo-hydrolase [Anaerolineae bacterium]